MGSNEKALTKGLTGISFYVVVRLDYRTYVDGENQLSVNPFILPRQEYLSRIFEVFDNKTVYTSHKRKRTGEYRVFTTTKMEDCLKFESLKTARMNMDRANNPDRKIDSCCPFTVVGIPAFELEWVVYADNLYYEDWDQVNVFYRKGYHLEPFFGIHRWGERLEAAKKFNVKDNILLFVLLLESLQGMEYRIQFTQNDYRNPIVPQDRDDYAFFQSFFMKLIITNPLASVLPDGDQEYFWRKGLGWAVEDSSPEEESSIQSSIHSSFPSSPAEEESPIPDPAQQDQPLPFSPFLEEISSFLFSEEKPQEEALQDLEMEVGQLFPEFLSSSYCF